MRMKIDLYRRLTRVTTREETTDLRTEMLDRFGPLATSVERMVKFAEIRVAAAHWQIESIGREEGYVVFQFASRPKIEELNRANRGRLRIVDNRSAYLPHDKGLTDPEALLATVESVLCPE
jgi:transcription-repair coupling factor (superfamily II helicase)